MNLHGCLCLLFESGHGKKVGKIKGDNVLGSGTCEERALKASLFTTDSQNGDRGNRSIRVCRGVNRGS